MSSKNDNLVSKQTGCIFSNPFPWLPSPGSLRPVKYAGILDEMKRQLKAFQERTGDPWVIKWEYQ